MGIVDSLKQRQNKKWESAEPTPRGLSLVEIRDDNDKSYHFGQMLEKSGKHELAVKFAEGTLDANDLGIINKQRLLFLEKTAQVEKIEEMVTEENIINIARKHPQFQEIVDNITPEKAVEAIRGQLMEMSINDEGRFNRIIKYTQTLDSYKNGELKVLEKNVSQLLKDNNISSKEYEGALAIEDPQEKEKALKELASKIPGEARKFLRSLTVGILGKGGTLNEDTLRNLVESGAAIGESVKELRGHEHNVDYILASSLWNNQNMQENLLKELNPGQKAEKPKIGIMEARKKVGFNEKAYQEGWEKKKKETDGYEGFDEDKRKALREGYLKEQKASLKEITETKGWVQQIWADIIAGFNEKLIREKKDTLKL